MPRLTSSPSWPTSGSATSSSRLRSRSRRTFPRARALRAAPLGGRGEEDAGDLRRRLYRNGYEEGRLKTAEEGEVEVRIPQVRGAADPYRSKLMEFLGGD